MAMLPASTARGLSFAQGLSLIPSYNFPRLLLDPVNNNEVSLDCWISLNLTLKFLTLFRLILLINPLTRTRVYLHSLHHFLFLPICEKFAYYPFPSSQCLHRNARKEFVDSSMSKQVRREHLLTRSKRKRNFCRGVFSARERPRGLKLTRSRGWISSLKGRARWRYFQRQKGEYCSSCDGIEMRFESIGTKFYIYRNRFRDLKLIVQVMLAWQ